MTNISNNIERLRDEMRRKSISACIIADSDPHLSEYIADYWKERTWLSGFDGSNGIVVLTLEKAALWTDSRYTLQAQNQLKDTGFQVFTTRNAVIDAVRWLLAEFPTGKHQINIRFDVFSEKTFEEIGKTFDTRFSLVFNDLISTLWKNRPAVPQNKIFLLDEKFSGKSAREKLSEIRAHLKEKKTNILILTALDDIAWTFNIRGTDIAYNPVATAYAVVEEEASILFIAQEKLSTEVRQSLERQDISIKEYTEIQHYINQLETGKNILVDKAKINRQLFASIPAKCNILDETSFVAQRKSKKNETEIVGIRNACIKDGVALVRFALWLEQNIENEAITEITIDKKIKEFRAAQDLFFSESFATIAGFKKHGAIVHYQATEATNARLRPESFLLLDTGAQYLNGTTDITRTIALGEPTPQQKKDYTLVLKGHIALASAHFPAGTFGFQLDTLARQFLWNNGLNYGHGTGHGIGHFLNVHEGMQSIRTDTNATALEAGMILSNEPGLYRTNEYGIRLENMMLVKESEETAFGKFMAFETLTLFPFDKRAINDTLLNKDETDWLDNYHQTVWEKLSPHLNEEGKKWLIQKIS